MDEYRGIFRMLKESHLLFDLVDVRETEQIVEKAGRYSLILLPGIDWLEPSAAEALETSKAVVAATGAALRRQPELLKRLFGISLGEALPAVRGCYLLTEPKEVFEDFSDRDWVYLDRDYYFMEPEKENENYLPLIRAGMYGPPERCQGYEITDQSSVSVRRGKSVYFPWMPGTLYHLHGYEDFRQLFLDVLRKNGDMENRLLQADAPPCAEVFFDRCGPGQYLLQILNYSGYNGTTFSKPLPVEVTVTLKNIQVEKVQLLTGGGRKKLSDQARFRLKVQGLYQAVLVTGKEEV